MDKPVLGIEYLAHAVGLCLPQYHSQDASGIDIYAAIADDLFIESQCYVSIPTGMKIILPPQCEAQIRPRSGLAMKHGVTILNSPGTIDNDYRGEIIILLINHGKERFHVTRGMRIAQLVVMQYIQVQIQEMHVQTQQTQRGEKGFGSTGL